MILDSLLTGVMLFSSFAMRTPNVQPNPDDYELSIGIDHKTYHINRQWERELGKHYKDDLIWLKWDNGIYFKPEYMNKQSQNVKYLKLDWRNKYKKWTYGFTSRNNHQDVFSKNWITFASLGYSNKKVYYKVIDFEMTFDGYLPPDENGNNTKFEYENKFKISWKVTDQVKVYHLGEVSKLQDNEFYKTKIGIEITI